MEDSYPLLKHAIQWKGKFFPYKEIDISIFIQIRSSLVVRHKISENKQFVLVVIGYLSTSHIFTYLRGNVPELIAKK